MAEYEQIACVVPVPENPLKLKLRLSKSPIRKNIRGSGRGSLPCDQPEAEDVSVSSRLLHHSDCRKAACSLESRNLFADFPKIHSEIGTDAETGNSPRVSVVVSLPGPEPGSGNTLMVTGGVQQGEHCYDGSLQPSPKDSAVDMSSPIRTAEEVMHMESSGNNTESGGDLSPDDRASGLSQPRSDDERGSELPHIVYPPCSVSQSPWERPSLLPDTIIKGTNDLRDSQDCPASTACGKFDDGTVLSRSISEGHSNEQDAMDSGNESGADTGILPLDSGSGSGRVCSSPDDGSVYGGPPLLTPQDSAKGYVYDNHSMGHLSVGGEEDADSWCNASAGSGSAPTLVSSHLPAAGSGSISQTNGQDKASVAPMFSASEDEGEDDAFDNQNTLAVLDRSLSQGSDGMDSIKFTMTLGGMDSRSGRQSPGHASCISGLQFGDSVVSSQQLSSEDDDFELPSKRLRPCKSVSKRRKVRKRKATKQHTSLPCNKDIRPSCVKLVPLSTASTTSSTPSTGSSTSFSTFHDAFAKFVAQSTRLTEKPVLATVQLSSDDNIDEMEPNQNSIAPLQSSCEPTSASKPSSLGGSRYSPILSTLEAESRVQLDCKVVCQRAMLSQSINHSQKLAVPDSCRRSQRKKKKVPTATLR